MLSVGDLVKPKNKSFMIFLPDTIRPPRKNAVIIAYTKEIRSMIYLEPVSKTRVHVLMVMHSGKTKIQIVSANQLTNVF
jgi:hypothetical protein